MKYGLSTCIDEHNPRAVVALFSGGHDSTVATHFSLPHLTHAAHINTGTGIPETTEYVEERCREWGLPLIELVTPPDVYENFVLGHGYKQAGFPGPSAHNTIYYYLKQRRVRELRNMFVRRRGQRVVFVTGIRSRESTRRMGRGISVPVRREGSIVWVNPILEMSDADVRAYLEVHNIQRNPVTEHLHRSGECLCGAFANPDELDEISFFYPTVGARIRRLERTAKEAGIARCNWGGGARREKPNVPGPLCSSCTARFLP